MRVSINLATHPFVELRPLFARLRLAMAGLAVLAIGLGTGLHFLGARAKAAEGRMNALKAQTLSVQTERQTNERRMQQPQNKAVLERSKFLNALFARKSFSWTAVMMDLEGVLPAGVEVTSIDPVITAEGDVNIRMRVSGERDREVDLVRRLELSKRFLEPRLATETTQSQEGKAVQVSSVGASGPAAVEFEIVSGYNPLPAVKVPGEKQAGTVVTKPGSKTGKDAGAAGVGNKSATTNATGPRPSAAGAPKAGGAH